MNAAGELHLYPGRELPSIEGGRPDLASRVVLGRPAGLVPTLLGALFTLCPMPHRVAAKAALAAAAGRPMPPDRAARRALQASQAREQILRIGHDWLRQWPGLDERPSAAGQRLLRDCPLWNSKLAIEEQLGALPRWMAEHWEPALDLLLRPLQPRAERLACPGMSLNLLADTATHLPRLAALMAEAPGFCAQPDWQGQPLDTGPWSRHRGPLPAATAWQRMSSRVADVRQLVGPDGEAWLTQGVLPLADDEAVAWVEMARGLLVHWVRLEPGNDPETRRVAAYRVLAPTEWNFHPRGSLAQALSTLHGAETDTDARVLALAYDPCVSFSVHGGTGTARDA
jgi:hypothetical protein